LVRVYFPTEEENAADKVERQVKKSSADMSMALATGSVRALLEWLTQHS
jgi:hypothetical protein